MKPEVTYGVLNVGDIVTDPLVWGKKRFVILRQIGNEYCPSLSVRSVALGTFTMTLEEERARAHKNPILDARHVKLVDAPHRPLRKASDAALQLLVNRNVREAHREQQMRNNV